MKFSHGKPKPLNKYKLMTSVMKYSRSHQLFCCYISERNCQWQVFQIPAADDPGSKYTIKRRKENMLTSLAFVFLLGLAMAALCQRIKIPRIIGMLLTGILLGPCVLN